MAAELSLTYLNRPAVEALELTDDEILGAVEGGLRAHGRRDGAPALGELEAVSGRALDRDAETDIRVWSRAGHSASVPRMLRVRTIALGSAGVLGAALARRRTLRWGATDAEVSIVLPGDDLMPRAELVSTRAVTVAAAPEEVWPWIAQLGQGRGGLYSYDFLENLVGCDMHSADRIVPGWQRVEVGDEVRLHPEVALAVAVVEPGRALVLRGGVPMGEAAPPYDFTWAFVLRGEPDGTTRLIARERYHYTRWWSALLVEPVEAVSFVMSRRMLQGIRDRAERAVQAT